MAQSIRVSDDVYRLASDVSEVQGRSLAQQVEYWVRLGVAVEAAGLTASQAMALLGGDATALRTAVAQLAAGLGGDPGVAAAQQRLARKVEQGKRSAKDLLMFSGGLARRARAHFPPETEGQGW